MTSNRLAAAIVLLAGALMTAATLAATRNVTGSGKAVTQARPVTGFDGVSLSVPGNLVITQGAEEGLTLTADDNLAPEIETVVQDRILKIRFRESLNASPRTPIRIALRARTLQSLAVAGAGDIDAPRISARQLKVNIAGSGDVRVGGKVAALDINVAGSGNLQAGRLQSEEARVAIAGSGNAEVWVRSALKVNVVGSGDVRYFGDPSVQRNVLGSGSVVRAGNAPG